MPYLKNGKHKVYYEIHRDSPMLVFLHGATMNHTLLGHQIKYAQKLGYGTLAIDLRGAGKSTYSKDKSFYDVENYVEDITKILKKEKIRKIIPVGFSHGGMVAQAFAAMYPKKTQGLILIATTYNINETFCNTLPKKLFFHGSTAIKKLMLIYNQFVSLFHPLKDNPPNYTSEKYKHMNTAQFVIDHYLTRSADRIKAELQFSSNIRFQDIKEHTKKIRCPTIIIQGKNDISITPDVAEALHTMIPSSSKPIYIEQGDHGMAFNLPNEVNNILKKGLDYIYNHKTLKA